MMANTFLWSNIVQQLLSFALVDDLLHTPKYEVNSWTCPRKPQLSFMEENLRHAKGVLYPNPPKGNKSLELFLPLPSHTEPYFHPDYQSRTLTLIERNHTYPYPDVYDSVSNRSLHDEVLERIWYQILDF